MGLVNMGVSENGAHPFSLWETYDPVVHSMGGLLLGLPLSKKTKNINRLVIWWYNLFWFQENPWENGTKNKTRDTAEPPNEELDPENPYG